MLMFETLIKSFTLSWKTLNKNTVWKNLTKTKQWFFDLILFKINNYEYVARMMS
jgi:hypothetical protein